MEPGELHSQEEDAAAQRFEKEQAWQLKEREIEAVTDRLGFPIEPGIKDVVVGLNLLGLNTTQSCEGHPDRGMGAPWVEVAAPDEPVWRFAGQKEIFQNVADKYGVDLEAVLRADNEDAWKEAWNLTINNDADPTPDYLAGRKKIS